MSAKRILIVANRTAATHRLLDEVKRRARVPCELALLVPATRRPDWTADTARGVLTRAAGRRVTTVAGDPVEAAGGYDEVIVSVAPGRIAGLAHRDLAHRLARCGRPVTVIGPRKPKLTLRETAKMSFQADVIPNAERWDDR